MAQVRGRWEKEQRKQEIQNKRGETGPAFGVLFASVARVNPVWPDPQAFQAAISVYPAKPACVENSKDKERDVPKHQSQFGVTAPSKHKMGTKKRSIR